MVNLEINSSEIPYVMSVSSNSQISVHKFENEMWTMVGNTINGEESQSEMALAPDGTPYVLTRSGSLKVFRYDGSAWTQVGGSLGDGFHIDITVADDGSPFVSFMDIANDAKGICKKWDGTSWITVGGTHFSGNQVAVWTKVRTNSSNQPVVLYGTGPSSNGPFYSNVSQFNGTNWEVIGGGDIDGNISTYFTHSLAIDSGDQFYVGLTANSASKKLNVYEWNGTSWINIGDNISGGDTYEISIALDLQDKPVVGFRDESEGGRTTVMRFDQNSWSTLGLAGFTNIASYQSLAYSPNGSPYIAYQDEENNLRATVKRYGPEVLNIVDHSSNKVDIRVFPKPNSGEFTLLSNSAGRYQLIDLQGRIIAEGVLEAINSENEMVTYSLKYPNLSKGMYLLNVMNADKRGVVKIIVQ